MGQSLQHNEPVAEDDDVEGHGKDINANEPVAEDDDVEGHGVIRNAAIATAIAVGGGAVAAAVPASAHETCVAKTADLCADTDEAYDDAGKTVDEAEGEAVGAAGFVIGLLRWVRR